jgi:hypothetical protein
MALCAGATPHYTTIAHFVSSMGTLINKIFLDILLVCDEMGLIGYNNFALDGCKMSSNASKEWSGKNSDFLNKQEKLKKTLVLLQRQHTENDKTAQLLDNKKEQQIKRISNIKKKIDKLNNWVRNNEDKPSRSAQRRGAILQSNITDNDSAKMQSSNGVIQGYNCQAIVDEKSQIVCYADAVGHGNDNHAFIPSVSGVKDNLYKIGKTKKQIDSITYLADTGYYNIEALEYIETENLKAIVPDNQYRKRDIRFITKSRHVRPYNGKKTVNKKSPRFEREDFKYVESQDYFLCPAKKILKKTSYSKEMFGKIGRRYRARISDCAKCEYKQKCLSEKGKERSLFITDKFVKNEKRDELKKKMMQLIDSKEGKDLYSKRMGIVEPVFANICAAKKLNRINLRGLEKVNTQWTLYCLVNNIEKIKNLKYKMISSTQ